MLVSNYKVRRYRKQMIICSIKCLQYLLLSLKVGYGKDCKYRGGKLFDSDCARMLILIGKYALQVLPIVITQVSRRVRVFI